MEVFLAAPYMLYFSIEKGVEPCFRNRINNIIEQITKKRISVVSAYARENWEVDIDTPEDAVNYDFHGIEKADFLMAFIGDDKPSSGVLMEIGFASALKKRIYIFYHTRLTPFPFLIKGLNIWTQTVLIEYENDEDIYNKLKLLLSGITREDAAQ